MIVAIHQPQYLPWTGYLDKAAQCDIFIYLDDVQYQRRGFQNRNQIKQSEGPATLTVPVSADRETLIKDVRIAGSDWRRQHLRAFELNYRKAPGFDAVFPIMQEMLSREWKLLGDLNIAITEWLFKRLEIGCERRRSSAIAASGSKQERIIELCAASGATTYLSGTGAAAYQREEEFTQRGIALRYQRYEPMEYGQCFPAKGFAPGMSAIDLLMNEPEAAVEIFRRGRRPMMRAAELENL